MLRFLWHFILVFFWLNFFNAVFGQYNDDYFLNKGVNYMEQGDYDSSAYFLEYGLNLAKKHNADNVGIYYLKLGKSLKLNSDFEGAFKMYTKAEETFKAQQNIEGQARCYVSFIEYYRARGKYEQAINKISAMRELIANNKIPLEIQGDFYSRYAAIQMERYSRPDSSLFYSNKVLEIAQKTHDRHLEATAYNELGYALEHMQDRNAIQHYQKAYEIWSEDNNYRYIITALDNIGRWETIFGSVEKAIQCYKKAIKISKDHNYTTVRIYLLRNLFNAYSSQKDNEKMLETHLELHALEMKSLQQSMSKSLNEVEMKYDVEKEINKTQREKQRAMLAENQAKNKSNQIRIYAYISFLLIVLLITIILLAVKLNHSNSELRAGNNQLNELVAQKEVLFKELHHRVKNNLTLLKSLLYLRAKTTEDIEIKRVLEECQSQINSMSVVHQKLYQIDNTTKIQLKDFIEQLFNEIKDALLPPNKPVTITVLGDNTTIDVSTAISLGLILNELATNSIKYGVQEHMILEFGLTISKKKEKIQLQYWDNGPGLSKQKLDLESGTGFGYKLIRIMLSQLDSSVAYSLHLNKPTFTFEFICSTKA